MAWRPSAIPLSLLLGALLAATPARAQDWASTEYDYASRQLTDFTNRFQDDLVDPVLGKMRRDAAAAKRSGTPSPRTAKAQVTSKTAAVAGPILFTPVRVPAAQSTARRIAAAYPANARAKAEAMFNQLLTSYAEVEKLNGVPHGDLGAAVAFFLGGNWMAMNNRDLSDAAFVPIIAQMRTSLSASPGIARLTNGQKQEIYEQMVINGMFMATTQMALRKKPDPEMVTKMKAAGRANLTQWLGADATGLRVTPQGLELAAAD